MIFRKTGVPLALLAAMLAGWAQGATVPTFNHDIAAILYSKCMGCHREGEVAPFPLITWNDARKRAQLISEVTRSRQMPPWQPEPGFVQFAGDRRLSEAEIRVFERWAKSEYSPAP